MSLIIRFQRGTKQYFALPWLFSGGEYFPLFSMAPSALGGGGGFAKLRSSAVGGVGKREPKIGRQVVYGRSHRKFISFIPQVIVLKVTAKLVLDRNNHIVYM